MIEPTLRGGMLLFLVALCLQGCAGQKARPVSPARVQAMEHNRRGVEAEARGDRERALAEFAEALRLQSSIDNGDGMIVALVNSARTQRLTGDLTAALASVERAFTLLREGSELAAEVCYEKAKVLASAGELAAASDWAVRAEAAEKGVQRGRRLNLVAALKLRQGDPDQAGVLSERALDMNRKAGLLAEEANSLRLLGEINLRQGSYGKALGNYRGALSLDKELGFSAKIAADLSGLGAAAAGKGDHAGAIAWYRRSLEVSKSGGDASRAAAIRGELEQLYRLAGGEGGATEMEAENGKRLPAAQAAQNRPALPPR